ncbi:MAG: DUF4923 family protein [Bacteroidaceae bacterium]|nr:DUF4923 family protein [Bacteroidaceae bacterium]
MKKTTYLAAILAASLTLTSCGTGLLSGATAAAGTTAATGSLLGNSLTTTGAGLLGNLLSNILSGSTTQQSLVGTWTYYGPKVVFESENILSQIGGQVVSNNLEQKLGTQLSKLGFTAGKSVLVLNADNSCTLTIGSKTLPGTYAYDSSTNKLTITGALGVGQVTCTATIQGNQLLMLFEADKLLSIATSLSSKSTSTLSSLLSSYTGLKLGWAMTK